MLTNLFPEGFTAKFTQDLSSEDTLPLTYVCSVQPTALTGNEDPYIKHQTVWRKGSAKASIMKGW